MAGSGKAQGYHISLFHSAKSLSLLGSPVFLPSFPSATIHCGCPLACSWRNSKPFQCCYEVIHLLYNLPPVISPRKQPYPCRGQDQVLIAAAGEQDVPQVWGLLASVFLSSEIRSPKTSSYSSMGITHLTTWSSGASSPHCTSGSHSFHTPSKVWFRWKPY